MRTLRALILMPLVLLLIFGLVVPLFYLYTAATLPNRIEGPLQIETLLRQSIESERQSLQYHKNVKDRENVTWPSPDFSTLPKLLVALYITQNGCPTYFQTPRETGLAWKRRVFSSLLDKKLPGDGACELIFSERLAMRLGATTRIDVAVAADRIHEFLLKDQLVAFDLHSTQFGRGTIGVEAASKELMFKNLLDLDLAELAELQIGIPPLGYWKEMHDCSNAPLIRQTRDKLLDDLMTTGFINAEAAKNASEPAPRCLSIVRPPGAVFHGDE